MAERGEGNGDCNRGDGLPPGPGNGGCNRSDGLPPVPGTPSQQSKIARIWDGWTNTGRKCSAWFSEHHAPAAAATATTSKCVTECAGILRARQTWMQVLKVVRCRDVNKETCPQARTGTSMVWCAMDSPTTNVYAADCASACTEFWLCEYAWWTKVWWFSKLRSEPNELPRKHAEWPGWSDFGRFDASSSADPRSHGHVMQSE